MPDNPPAPLTAPLTGEQVWGKMRKSCYLEYLGECTEPTAPYHAPCTYTTCPLLKGEADA